ncbi:hypothetical protein R1flu_015934 [Riccia fluitans]|uniref:HpcH/HpaI aldolase/citrate lyase domain-containing protein n=1 Tax=Riccia fluitans TaxID=41844 RepID=A0ABD1YKD7_9MARC
MYSVSEKKRTGAMAPLGRNGIVAPGISEFFTQSGGPPSLKSRLLNGEKLYGALSVSYSPVNAEILGWAGYDFVVVDMEHGPGDTFSALSILRALSSAGTPAIIRVPDNDEIYVKWLSIWAQQASCSQRLTVQKKQEMQLLHVDILLLDVEELLLHLSGHLAMG